MAIKIEVPELGESVLEATVARWLKKEGDFVNVGEVLVELETDKVNLEVGAKGNGVLQNIQAAEGADVKVGDVLGTIEEKAGEPQAEATQSQEQAQKETPTPEPEAAVETQPTKPQAEKEAAPARKDGQQLERQAASQVSPVAARFARDKNVDISKITGTGNEGRVTKADVEMYLQRQGADQIAEKPSSAQAQQSVQPQLYERAAPSLTVPSSDRQEERTRMSRSRRTIGQRLLEATQSRAML